MASRKGSRIVWRWVAVGATLAAGMAIYSGKRMSRRARRAMARERAATRFPAPPGPAPSARDATTRPGAPTPVR